MHDRPRAETGFTVIEALLAAAIFSLIMLGALSVFATNSKLFHTGQSHAGTQQNARVALENAAREIRMAGYDHSGVIDSLGIKSGMQQARSDTVTFVADLTGDDVLDEVTYSLQGTRLVRSISSWTGSSFSVASSGDVADGVTLLAFAYFDENGAAMATPVPSANLDDIRRITVSLVTTEATVTQQRDFPLIVDVELRNEG